MHEETQRRLAATEAAMEELERITVKTKPKIILELAKIAEQKGKFLHAALLLHRGVTRKVLNPSQVASELIKYADREAEKRNETNAARILGLGTEIHAFSSKHAQDFRRHIDIAAGEVGRIKTVVASAIMHNGVKAGILKPEEVRDDLIRYARRRAELERFADAHAILQNGARSGILTREHKGVFEEIAQQAEASTWHKKTAHLFRRTMAKLRSTER